ncbi:CHAT domain-containing protein [Roseateles oligotrophus]|uniref:CHAT domain-containing protein n=1 Tax=Roseateles oligotrophus TaxID=1769250 RepID=A0ABT2YF71_9BURK|nr:CHAT domain-containing protein [Roseateles oligotrophus]MCV2368671.1 CHAT domain-containing protein [Roseateles oligotrophus]
MAEHSIPIKLNGRPDERPRLPPLLTPAARSADRRDDAFLPDGYLQPLSAFDLSPAARGVGSADTAAMAQTHAAAANEVLVLELSDGSTLITSAGRLRETLLQTHPEMIAEDGTILLEALRSQGAAPGRGLGEAVGGLISKVYSFAVGAVPDAIIDAALGQLKNKAELGVTWAGTKALMWAIEKQLSQAPGLYRWVAATGKPQDLEDCGFEARPPVGEMLVFVHGTGSSTLGSFGELRSGDRDLWGALQARFTGGIYGFEHRTLSQSPIENAIDLVRALPLGARICLVSHSRGGLVADLLCLGDFDALIDGYAFGFEGTGDADAAEAERVIKELGAAHAEQRQQLRALAGLLRERKIVVQRYVRAASPANGTKLASGNFDVFLSGLLSLIGTVPFFFGSPLYSAFKRVVIEIAKNRTNAHLVPGIEAMLPDSPMARLLHDAPVRPGTLMSIIAGDIEGGNMLRRLGVMLTDFLLFDNDDNDLVVNTTSMLAGIAPKSAARVLFDRGADVSHFRYFVNIDTRAALRDWLLVAEPQKLTSFRALPDPADYAAALAAAGASRALGAADRPIVVVLPGIMGSHLQAGANDRVWFDPADIATGGLSKIEWSRPSVEAEELFAMFYGRVCKHLAESHRVEPFPYDWRQPLDVLAERLGEFLDRLMRQTQQPIRLLAHSMGGLVVRACIYKRRAVIDQLMARAGARLIMLGTPNQGAHSMVENLIGKGDTLRKLVRLDVRHDMQEVLDIIAGFRGALQLLPKPGFVDTFQGLPDGGGNFAYQQAQTWTELKSKVRDFWFGDRHAGTPSQAVLDAASWLWTQDGAAQPALPGAYEAKSVYIFGQAPNTPCGLREEGTGANVRLKMVGTTRGDGTVSWASGRIGGIGRFYYLPAAHGDLLSTSAYFTALTELLNSGSTAALSTQAPTTRAIEHAQPVSYDAGPPTVDDPDALLRAVMGSSSRNRVPARTQRRLEVAVKAMDLRFVSDPVLVGHYEHDPISGAEALIDRELLNKELSERYSLGLYAGARGSATVVLRVRGDFERQLGVLSGAVVTGLGSYDRALSPADLTEAVRTGALRYLLQVIDVLGKSDREVPLASLLLGYNSSANLTVAASVEALVRGVMEANARFYAATRLNIRIGRLDIIELYLDTAIGATYALRNLSAQLAAQAEKQGTALLCQDELQQCEGFRQRLFDDGNSSYWPRLIITDAERSEAQNLAAHTGQAAPLADKLRFVFVGQRARAESVALQRQPGLIEQMVAQQIANPIWNEDFGRMLFQLMVPHDFKDAARQLDRVVLVVDGYTANLPWELMLADDPDRPSDEKQPLALRTAVVRQLAAQTFRASVHQSATRSALVIANPSVAGFSKGFPFLNGQPTQAPPDLPGARAEGEACQELLTGMGYEVEAVIGRGDEYGNKASDVLSKLYAKPWRILHISAHGVFDLPHADGRKRSGVLLSDGLLITAAEIMAMEVVPELVFLNCCHLGQVDSEQSGPASNKLAASVAREMIAIGVRCVVVAGWAVNDESAQLFGQVFYEQLLLRRQPFGDAVFSARKEVWKSHPEDITWGAFQAYGDPIWLAEPAAEGVAGAGPASPYVSPDEMLDELARLRADLARRGDFLGARELQAQLEHVADSLARRCPAGWQQNPQLQYALGQTWFDLGQWERARAAFLSAAQAVDRSGGVPISDLEKLVDVESRLGEARALEALGRALGGDPQALQQAQAGEALIELALRRLDGLDALVADGDGANPTPSSTMHSERTALRGAAWQRKAHLQARRLLSGLLDTAAADAAALEMARCLQQGVEAYRAGEGQPGSEHFSPCHALYRLALDALTDWHGPAERDAAIELAQQCRRTAVRNFAMQPSPWDLLIQPEALLVERMIDGKLGRPDEEGRHWFDELSASYTEALRCVTVRPMQLEAMVDRLERLSRFVDALALAQHDDAALSRSAGQLIALAQGILPSHAARTDRPAKKEHKAAKAAKSRRP